ncbi:MAG: OmpA family protein [Granulosicoccus sp.]|nr:OmpA family protein [Granulosicoccus sp.]
MTTLKTDYYSLGAPRQNLQYFGFCMLATVVLVLSAFTSATFASEQIQQQDRQTVYFDTPPSAEEVGQYLFAEPEPVKRTRSISFRNPEEQRLGQRSVGMPVLFRYGETKIVEESKPFLDTIGEMMASAQYENEKLIVEGHTDAVGSDEFNQKLSDMRALAIRDYLVAKFSIDPFRLFPVGRGESLLYQPDKPNDATNRRVEFLAFGNNRRGAR